MLAREHRLRSSDEIRGVIKSGKRASNSIGTLHYLPAETPRFAVVTSKSLGNAVIRNRTRRRAKAVLFELVQINPEISGVLRLRPEATSLSFQELKDLITELVGRTK